MVDQIEVTDADREAAWPYADFHCLPDRQMRERWFSGYYDDHPQGAAIKDFARNRLAATKAALEAAEQAVSGDDPLASLRAQAILAIDPASVKDRA